MQGLTQRIWSLASNCHVGDQAWQRFTDADEQWPAALWESSGEVLAWGWAQLPGRLELLVDPAHPDLVGTVLDWFASIATAPTLTVTVTDTQKYVIAALAERGWAPADRKAYYSYQTRELADLPEPLLPTGFTARPIREADLDRRLAVHHAAWANTGLTESNYRNVMAAWPYRTDLDWVVETPDDDFAAYCLIWPDDRNRVGLLEPVGTDPRFRRQGLGRAVCLAAMHALRAAGADRAVVYPTFGHGHPGAIPLYADLGFRQYARSVAYTRTAG